MIKYRLAKPEDEFQIIQLCDKHSISLPTGKIFVAEEEGKITGVCAVRMQAMIEPLISGSPMSAQHLVSMAEGLLIGTGSKSIMALVKEGNTDLFTKYGFIDHSETLMEKFY